MMARIKDPALLELLKYEHDCCELTGETENLHLHHVIFKSHGGDDLRANIVCMVGWLHDAYHAGDRAARQRLAHHVNTERTDVAAYISEKLSGPEALLEWFSRHGLPVAA
jgi:hypothetical protein